MKSEPLTLILCLVVCSAGTQKKIPEYITICKRNDPKLGECWASNYNVIIPHLANGGIPELNVAPIEPFVLDKISLVIGAGTAVSFTAELQDTKLWGLKDSKCLAANINFKEGIFNSSLLTPYIHISSKYSAKGKVMLFQFDSSGHFSLNLTNPNLNYTYQSQIVERNGKQYINGNVTYIDVGMDEINIYLENLFPNKDLNAAANNAFNANIDVIYEEIKPLLLKSVGNVLASILNNVLDASIPLDVFYPLH